MLHVKCSIFCMTKNIIPMINRFLIVVFLLLASTGSYAQTGLSVSPPRLYFELLKGQSGTEKFVVTNVSDKITLDLALSLGDWKYNLHGENVVLPADSLEISCAKWINIRNEDSYFSLKPGERKEIEVTLNVPQILRPNVSVSTAMIYVTQMNPIDDVNSKGANFKVSMRSGVKVYFREAQHKIQKLELHNLAFVKQSKSIKLSFESVGNIWIDGYVYTDLLNTETGQKFKINKDTFYSLPGDKRDMLIALPKDLPKGKYVATVLIDIGDENRMEAAELSFSYE